jgi:hypothetical protein
VEIIPPAAGSSAARPISIDLDPLDNGHADTGANGMLMEAMQRTNMLQLVLFAPQLLSTWRAKLLRDVPRNGRDALDLAGKLPLALKGLGIGLEPEHLLLDCAQVVHAAGVH